MDAINTIVVNNAGNVVNPTTLAGQTVGSADFMTAFVNALSQGQMMTEQNGQTVDFAQLLENGALNGEEAELLKLLDGNVTMPEMTFVPQFNEGKNVVADNDAEILMNLQTTKMPQTDKMPEMPKIMATPVNNQTVDAENENAEMQVVTDTLKTNEVTENDVASKNVTSQTNSVGNNELSKEIAKNLIMTGDAKDFSAGYLSLISQSENAVDLQTILSSVGTLNGSVSQSLGLINAMEKAGISQFVGLNDDGETVGTLSAEQLVMLSTLAGNSSSKNSSGSTLVDLLLNENFGGMGNLNSMGVTALLGGFGDYSAESLMGMMSGTGGLNSVLSALKDDDNNNYSSLLGIDGFNSSNLLSSVFNTNNDKNDDVAIPMSAAIPIDALKQLANVKQRENISNLEKLAEAFENGEATVSKTTQFVLADNDVKNVAYKNQQEGVENAPQMTQETSVSDDNSQKDFSDADKLIYENNFNNAVREAKKNINRETKAVDNQSLPQFADIEAQTFESQNKIAQITRAVRDNVTASNVRQQTVEQISAKLTQKYETVETFSVKLTPEGLGDVVVNLEKTEEGIVLELVASKESTAKLLDSEMGELQSALSQFNAQVNEIRVAEPVNAQTQTNDGFLQQDFSEQFEQNQGTYRQGTPSYARARNTISEQSVENNEPVYRDNSKINTYI